MRTTTERLAALSAEDRARHEAIIEKHDGRSWSEDVALAGRLLGVYLSAGPQRPRDVRARAAAEGYSIREQAWTVARRRVGALSEKVGGSSWLWSLPGAGEADDLEGAFAVWLATPAGRFAEYLVERERIDDDPQLSLDVEAP